MCKSTIGGIFGIDESFLEHIPESTFVDEQMNECKYCMTCATLLGVTVIILANKIVELNSVTKV